MIKFQLLYIRWVRTINEKEVSVFDPTFDKLMLLILRFIQSNHMRHSKMLKHL